MSIPKNISPSNITQAISEISSQDIPKSRESYVYFLNHNDKKLPPKYVISIANKHANGKELSSEDFNAVQAVFFLKKLGFQVDRANELVNIKLYDIHGSSALKNYTTLISNDQKYFYWDSKRFLKYEKGDIVFWINRTAKVALYTIVDSVQVKPEFSDGRNTINDLGYNVYASAQSETQFENFYRFRIEERLEIPEDWNYRVLSPFNGQTMAIILYENKVNDPLKKIEKINDIKRLFSKNDEVVDLLESATSLLEEKLKGDFKKIKDGFLKFMSKIHKNSSTSKDYVKMMPKIQKWFIENNIVTKDFIIWRDVNKIEKIENNLNGELAEIWKQKNKAEHNWYGSPWNM